MHTIYHLIAQIRRKKLKIFHVSITHFLLQKTDLKLQLLKAILDRLIFCKLEIEK